MPGRNLEDDSSVNQFQGNLYVSNILNRLYHIVWCVIQVNQNQGWSNGTGRYLKNWWFTYRIVNILKSRN